MNINRKDIFWNYTATFLKLGSPVILLPLILNKLSSDLIGIWNIFLTLTSLVALFDLGFKSSFTRNISYIYSGVKNLKINRLEVNESSEIIIDYGLLEGTIKAMKWFYLRISLISLFLISTLGTAYIYYILLKYQGSHTEVYFSWLILCLLTSYNLYTLYYESLLEGAGLIKRSKQIQIIGQVVYIFLAVLLIFLDLGIIAIISSQAVSLFIIRILSKKYFFTTDLQNKFDKAITKSARSIITTIYPNSLKIGATIIGGFLTKRSSIMIGAVFLELDEIASYGISAKLIEIICIFSSLYISTYIPKISQLRVINDYKTIRKIYYKGQLIQLTLSVVGILFLLFLGNHLFKMIGSNTFLINKTYLILLFIYYFLENNHSLAGNILLTNNEVPFFKSSLLTGLITITFLILFFKVFHLGLLSIIIAPGIANLYNNIKWPLLLNSQLGVTLSDIKLILFPNPKNE